MRLIKIILLITFNYSFSQEFNVSEFKINNSEILIEEVSAIGLDSENNIYIYQILSFKNIVIELKNVFRNFITVQNAYYFV